MEDTQVDALIEKLSILSINKNFSKMGVDLHDINESCHSYINFYQTINQKDIGKDELIEILIEVELELEHIAWHYKSLKKELLKVLK